MAKRRSGYVEVSVANLLDELDDADLLGEVEDRGLEAGLKDGVEEVREAYAELRRGRPAEALAILDRLLNPKWTSQQKCLEEFVKQQGKIL